MQSLHTLMPAQCSTSHDTASSFIAKPLTGSVLESCCLIMNHNLMLHQLKPSERGVF